VIKRKCNPKLTEDDVRLIRELVKERQALRDRAKLLNNDRLAEKFGVHFRTIERINSGELWGHIT